MSRPSLLRLTFSRRVFASCSRVASGRCRSPRTESSLGCSPSRMLATPACSGHYRGRLALLLWRSKKVEAKGVSFMNMSLGLLQSVGIGFAAIVLVAVVAVILFLLTSAIKIVKEYERGVIFRLGRVQGRAKGPGLFILIPAVDRMVKVGLRTVTLDVPPQDLITRDNVPARVTAVIYFRVVDPNKSVIEVENHVLATSQISQTTLRSVLGQKSLDDLLTNREAINEELQRIIDEQTEPWGVKVS